MSAGDIALFDSQGPGEGQQGQIRLAGFTAAGLCPQTGFCLVLDGATGGNNAFGILALLAAYKQFPNSTYLNAAVTIANWIYANLYSNKGYGGYFAGYPDQGIVPKTLENGKSTENNADIFAAFTALAAVESAEGDSSAASQWTMRANLAGDFVMQMYDKTTGHFFAGTVPAAQGVGAGINPSGPSNDGDVINTFDFLDAQTFTTLAMASAARYQSQIDWHAPLMWTMNHFQSSVTAAGMSFQGYDLIDATERAATGGPAGIAWEFTSQTIVAMKLVDSLYGTSQFSGQITSYLNQIHQVQTAAPFTDSQGVVAATLQNGDTIPPYDQCLVTPYQCIAERVGLAATIWAIAAEEGLNPLQGTGLPVQQPQATITGIFPASSSIPTITPGEWVSIFGTDLSASALTWSGNFPTSLGGTSVTIDGKAAYLSYVSPTKINLQVPDDSTIGSVPVVVTTAGAGSTNSTVTMAQVAPSFLLLDKTHVAGIILRTDGSGAYGGGTYDILGPTGTSLGYATVAAKAGDMVELFGTGFGPTNPPVVAGQAFSGASPATNAVSVFMNSTSVTHGFVGLSGPGLFQINMTIPANLGKGDVPLLATVENVSTPSGVVISLQ